MPLDIINFQEIETLVKGCNDNCNICDIRLQKHDCLLKYICSMDEEIKLKLCQLKIQYKQGVINAEKQNRAKNYSKCL